MKYLILIAVLAAVGCSTTDPTIPPPVEVPSVESLGTLGSNIDKGDSRVAAAVTVMVENNTKPTVVQSEGKVALAHLPKATEADLKHARTRAAAGDAKVYESEISRAAAWFIEVETEWNLALNESKKNASELIQARKDIDAARKDLAKANTQIAELKAEVESAAKNLWTMAGVGLFVVGVLAGATLGWRVGGSIVACAPLAAAVPVILSSEYFGVIVSVTLGLAACLLLWRLFDYIKDKNNEQPK